MKLESQTGRGGYYASADQGSCALLLKFDGSCQYEEWDYDIPLGDVYTTYLMDAASTEKLKTVLQERFDAPLAQQEGEKLCAAMLAVLYSQVKGPLSILLRESGIDYRVL